MLSSQVENALPIQFAVGAIDDMDDVGAVIAGLPKDREIHFARYAAFIETHRDRFGARVYENLPQYDRDFLLKVREAAREIFAGRAGRALGHATSGPALQQNLVCVMEARA